MLPPAECWPPGGDLYEGTFPTPAQSSGAGAGSSPMEPVAGACVPCRLRCSALCRGPRGVHHSNTDLALGGLQELPPQSRGEGSLRHREQHVQRLRGLENPWCVL